jgi:hypothetical protein
MTDNSQQVIALIKFFSEEQHYLSFKDGCSMFRTPHFYRKRDDIGRGDRSESCLGYWDKGLGDTIPSLINNDSSVDLTNAQSLLVYPAHEQRDAWLQSWCAIGPHNKFEQSLEKMLNEFGSYFVVLQASNIDEYVKLVSKASGADVSYGLVQYSDNPLDRSLTVKDSKLCYQEEFRFYVGECSKDEVRDKKLQLNGLNNILSNAASLKLTSPSGEIRYCSLGSKKVVTTNE